MSQNGQLHFKNFAANAKTICDNIIQFHALKICDTTSKLFGIIKPFQKIMKNKNVIELILNLKRLVSDNDDAITNCKFLFNCTLQ